MDNSEWIRNSANSLASAGAGGTTTKKKGNSKSKPSLLQLLWRRVLYPYRKYAPVIIIVGYLLGKYIGKYILYFFGSTFSLILVVALVLFYTPMGDVLHHRTANSLRNLPGASKTDWKYPKDKVAGKGLGNGMVSTHEHFDQFHGHPVSDLEKIHARLSSSNNNEEIGDDGAAAAAAAVAGKEFIFFAGDSSLDNKHWIAQHVAPAVNGYEKVLNPPTMVQDVNYWMNKFLQDLQQQRKAQKVTSERGGAGFFLSQPTACMMTSVEATTVSDRKERLLLQDQFIQSKFQGGDSLIVSVGGNDVALQPSVMTALSMAAIMYSPRWLIRSGYAPGWRHIHRVLYNQVNTYVKEMLQVSPSTTAAQTRFKSPKKVLLCNIYYPDQNPSGSWADATLELLGYNEDPTKLQFVIDQMFEQLPKEYTLPGTEGRTTGGGPGGVTVNRIALHRHGLDGKDSRDYVARVEPSVQGGEKMAKAFLQHLYPETEEFWKEEKKK